MEPRRPAPSFDGSPSHDSAIGTPHKTHSSRVSGTAPSTSSPLAAPPALANSDLPPVPSNASYTTAPEASTSSTGPRAEEDNGVERVLSLPRGRRTPSLRNAPDLQWNLSQPPTFSPSESGSVVSEDDAPVVRRESQRTTLSPILESPTPDGQRPRPDAERPTTPLPPPAPIRQPAAHTNFSRPTPRSVRQQPHEYQPLQLSPPHEFNDLRPRRYPGEVEGHPAYEPQPSLGSLSSRTPSSRATYSAEAEDPSSSTARLIPIQNVELDDAAREELARRNEIAAANNLLAPFFAPTPPNETEEEEMTRFHRQQQEEREKRKAWEKRHPHRRRMKNAWRKVKEFFNF